MLVLVLKQRQDIGLVRNGNIIWHIKRKRVQQVRLVGKATEEVKVVLVLK